MNLDCTSLTMELAVDHPERYAALREGMASLEVHARAQQIHIYSGSCELDAQEKWMTRWVYGVVLALTREAWLVVFHATN